MMTDEEIKAAEEKRRVEQARERADIRARLKTMAAIIRAGCDAIERGDFGAGAEVIGLASMHSPRTQLRVDDAGRLERALSDLSVGIKFFIRISEERE